MPESNTNLYVAKSHFETPFWIYHHKSQQLGRWVHDKFTVTFCDNINRPAKKGIPNYCNNYGILAKPWSFHHHFKFPRNLVQQIWSNFAMINSLRKAMADLVENMGWLLCNSLKNFTGVGVKKGQTIVAESNGRPSCGKQLSPPNHH
jgi:hypothetical protein